MTTATEKAAPIPAEVEKLARAIFRAVGMEPKAIDLRKACAAIMQDRADRASQEERIREDEREALARHMAAEYAQHETGYDWELTDRIWQEGWRKAANRALAAIDRARLRGGAS